MSKVEVVYIGQKAVKKDTVTCSRITFPRLEAVAVEEDIARNLLKYPSVWVLKSEVESVVAKQKSHEKALAKAKEEQAKQEAKTVKAESFLVMINDEEIDIAKYSSRQLDTVVEAQDLIITASKKPVDGFRLAVRDALRLLTDDGDKE